MSIQSIENDISEEVEVQTPDSEIVQPKESSEKVRNKSPSLLTSSGTGSHSSPLLAELGKIMLKRKKSEGADSAAADDDSEEANKGLNSLNSSTNEVEEVLSEPPNVPIAVEKSNSVKSVKVDADCIIEVMPTSSHLEKSLIRKCSTTDDNATEITLTCADSSVSKESQEAGGVPDTDDSDNMVSVSVTVDCNTLATPGPSSKEQPAARSSRIDSYYIDDLDTGLDYMYDSDEKTTVL